MILTVFRSRLNDDIRDEYEHFVATTSRLAEQAPGFLGHKMFVAEDGERVTLVEFDSIENQRAWSLSSEHKAAAMAGRRGFYSEYRIQICTVNRDSKFVAGEAPMAKRRETAEALAEPYAPEAHDHMAPDQQIATEQRQDARNVPQRTRAAHA